MYPKRMLKFQLVVACFNTKLLNVHSNFKIKVFTNDRRCIFLSK